MPATGESIDLPRLEHLITPERMAPYLIAMGGDLRQALALYDWNAEASAAVLAVASRVEVVFRNALDHQMQVWAISRGLSEWTDRAPLDQRGINDVREARRRTARYGAMATHGHLVAELNLGFWRYLCSRKYLASLWAPHLSAAFPFAAGSARVVRAQVESDAQQLLFLRNRAAHHEPIHRRNLAADLEQALRLVAAIDPVAEQWARARESVTEIASQRPMH